MGGLRLEAILYNSVNEDDMWKGFVNWVNLKENSQLDTIYPPYWLTLVTDLVISKKKIICISSNWVNDAQDSIAVKKFRDFQNSLIPNYQLSNEKEPGVSI